MRAASLLLATAIAVHPGGPREILGKKLWVEVQGTGEPILLIPGGGGGSHDYFHPHFDALHAHARVVYYDGFGRGRSERAASPAEYSVKRDVEEIEALRQSLGIERWTVYGHSYGGLVAQAYAVRYPASVKRLVLSNTFVSAEDYQASNDHFLRELREFLPELWEQVAKRRLEGHLANAPAMQEAFFGQITRLQELFYLYDRPAAARIVWDENAFNADAYYQLTGPDADFVVGGDIATLDFRASLPALRMPILVMAGRADGIVLPRLARRVHEHAPGSRFHVFEHSGHFPFLEETAAHAAVLREFLESDLP